LKALKLELHEISAICLNKKKAKNYLSPQRFRFRPASPFSQGGRQKKMLNIFVD
jgi:hypothetical protein